jgi:predicted nuclease of predicted toxin-antitoxin system
VKLLFDHNLSPRLVHLLIDLFPDSSHLYWLGLDQEGDRTVREYALQHDFIIVTKDADYSELCWWLGFPPKVVWIRRGNCKTSTIEEILRRHFDEIKAMQEDQMTGIIMLF